MNSLQTRINNHKKDFKRKPHLPLYMKIAEVGWEKVEWFVLEETNSRYEREQYWIEQNPEWCLNSIRANRTPDSIKKAQAKADKKRYKKCREDRISATTQWRAENREKWNAYQREYYRKKKQQG
jgi:hypothetical protein